MKKYIVLYHAPGGTTWKTESSSPEDMKKGMEAWMQWKERLGSGMVDMGSPLANGQKVTKQGASPSGTTVIGYSILQAENMDQAIEMLKGHPHLDWREGCEIEVHEAQELPGM